MDGGQLLDFAGGISSFGNWSLGTADGGAMGAMGPGSHPRGTVSTPKRRLESISQRRYDEKARAILVCGRVNLAGSVGPPSSPVTTEFTFCFATRPSKERHDQWKASAAGATAARDTPGRRGAQRGRERRARRTDTRIVSEERDVEEGRGERRGRALRD